MGHRDLKVPGIAFAPKSFSWQFIDTKEISLSFKTTPGHLDYTNPGKALPWLKSSVPELEAYVSSRFASGGYTMILCSQDVPTQVLENALKRMSLAVPTIKKKTESFFSYPKTASSSLTSTLKSNTTPYIDPVKASSVPPVKASSVPTKVQSVESASPDLVKKLELLNQIFEYCNFDELKSMGHRHLKIPGIASAPKSFSWQLIGTKEISLSFKTTPGHLDYTDSQKALPWLKSSVPELEAYVSARIASGGYTMILCSQDVPTQVLENALKRMSLAVPATNKGSVSFFSSDPSKVDELTSSEFRPMI